MSIPVTEYSPLLNEACSDFDTFWANRSDEINDAEQLMKTEYARLNRASGTQNQESKSILYLLLDRNTVHPPGTANDNVTFRNFVKGVLYIGLSHEGLTRPLDHFPTQFKTEDNDDEKTKALKVAINEQGYLTLIAVKDENKLIVTDLEHALIELFGRFMQQLTNVRPGQGHTSFNFNNPLAVARPKFALNVLVDTYNNYRVILEKNLPPSLAYYVCG
jgi:hypothetical protein